MRGIRVSGLLLPAVLLLFGGTVASAQLPGDLDGNGEVNLADLVDFVGCMNGPDGGSVDPTCDPGDFDPDTDIDLRDFAGFQKRFGFGQGPPQIISFTPTPGEWIVDDLGLTEVKVGFSEPVIVPADAVDVWLVGGGTVSGFTTSYDSDTFVLTISFAQPLRDDRVTVVVDYTIEDVAGNPLDGEIFDPKNAMLPSGNDINGGQGVFRIHVLQGDANRDGVVDAADEAIVDNSLDLCDGDPGFDARADLNNDGCVDDADVDVVTAGRGNQLHPTDGIPPRVDQVIVDDQRNDIFIVFSDGMLPRRFTPRSCFLVDSSGNIRVPTTVDVSIFLTGAAFEFASPLAPCVTYTVNVSNALADQSSELLILLASEPLPCP